MDSHTETRVREYDVWSHHELWRADNPGLSTAVGIRNAFCISAVMWVVIALLAWWVLF